MTLARRVWQGSDDAAFLVDSNLHPHVKAVIATRAKPLKISVVESDFKSEVTTEMFAALIAYPNSTGEVKNIKPIIEKIQAKNALAIRQSTSGEARHRPSQQHLTSRTTG